MDDGPEAERFMDEPSDVNAGLDDSLASEVGERVMKVMDDAERDAEAVARQAEDYAEKLLEEARAEARRVREDAARQARALGTDRVRRILELRREIGSRAEALASLSDAPDAVMAGVNRLLEALEARAEQITGEIGAKTAQVPEAPEAPEPPPASADGDGDDVAHSVDAALAAVAAEPSPEPLRETRLEALRLAVAGASRTDLEVELCETLDAQDAAAVLDDVFGRPRSPFPKWGAAVKRTR